MASVQAGQVRRHVGRAALRLRPAGGRSRPCHASEHQHAVGTAADRALDIGVQPVPDHQRGRFAPTRCTDSACNGGSGFPATIGSWPVACTRTWTSEPLPGCGPRGVGNVASALDATNKAPALSAIAASASSP